MHANVFSPTAHSCEFDQSDLLYHPEKIHLRFPVWSHKLNEAQNLWENEIGYEFTCYKLHECAQQLVFPKSETLFLSRRRVVCFWLVVLEVR